MKMYITDSGLRMVGKSWQVRAALRKFSKSKTSLKTYLDMHGQPHSRKNSFTTVSPVAPAAKKKA